MQALSQSSFLQALGYAIANSLWQVALLWLISLLINASIKLSSHSRYRLAITAQLAGFAWFVVTLQFYYQQCVKATADVQLLLLEKNTVIYQPDTVSSQYNILTSIAKAEMLLPYLSLAYLVLLGVLAVRWLKSYRYTSRLKKEGLQKAGMHLRLFVQDKALQLGIKQKVNIYLSTLVNCPLTVGFLKPVILVPVATVNHLSTQQLEAVLLHELAHIRRADYLINLLLNVIETILFFNPFTRLLAQSINKEREHCCDDWVLQFKYNAPMYAEALLRIACLQAAPAMAMKAEGKNEGELLWRVKRLLNQKQKRFNYSQQMVALVITTCMLVSIAWLQPAKNNKQLPQTAVIPAVKPVKAVVVAPMAAQIDNPFFNPLAFFSKPLNEEVQKATAEIAKTNLHEVVNTGLDEANKALTAVTPSVVSELDKLKSDNNFKQAAKRAQEELKKVKWAELQQLSPLIDSTFIANTVSTALENNNLAVRFEKAKQSLELSKQQISKLKQQNLDILINQDAINAAIDNATTWFSSNDFGKLWNEKKKEDAAPKPRLNDRKENLRRQEIILRRWMQNNAPPPVQSYNLTLPKRDDYYKTDDDAKEDKDLLAGWNYTNPVYVESPAVDNTNEDAVYSNTTAPQAPPLPPAKPQLHIVEVTNPAQGVSIIITIRE